MAVHRVISLVREVADLPLTRAFHTESGLRETSPALEDHRLVPEAVRAPILAAGR